jgi:hypothetical protein
MSLSTRTPTLAFAMALLLVASGVPAQIRMSQPKPTGVGPASGINPDSGAGGTDPAPAPGPRPASSAPAATPEATDLGTAPVTVPEVPPDEENADDETPRGGYDPEGRRDPFRPLTGEATDTDQRKEFEGTLRGRLLAEVKLTAIVKTPRGNIATFEGGPKKEGYFARVGDKFWDGVVTDISYETKTVVVRQQLNDPRLMAIKPYRDQVISLFGDTDSSKREASDSGN